MYDTLDKLLTLARLHTQNIQALDEAAAFLKFKRGAAEHLRELILMELQQGVTTFQWATGPLDGVTVETESRDTRFRLNLWVDSYLFELWGLRDGLAQLANQAFNLGFALDSARMGPVTKRIMQLCPPGRLTGLEAWTTLLTEAGSWLSTLNNLRNDAAHRQLVRMSEVKPWEPAMEPPPPRGKFVSEFQVEVTPGVVRPIRELLFVDLYEGAVGQARRSLNDLSGLLLILTSGARPA